jgi:hypothetical protein
VFSKFREQQESLIQGIFLAIFSNIRKKMRFGEAAASALTAGSSKWSHVFINLNFDTGIGFFFFLVKS